MGRIAATEDVEGIRDEQDLGDEAETSPEESMDTDTVDKSMSAEQPERAGGKRTRPRTGKYVATVQEVNEAFDSVNVLRYSQPFHLQGACS